MVESKFNKKAKMMDFYIGGKLVASADLADVAKVRAELEAKALKFAALHG